MSPTPTPTPTPSPDVWCDFQPSIECFTNPWHVPGGCTEQLCEPFPPEPTFNDRATAATGTLGDLALHHAWVFDWMSAGLTAMVLLGVAVLVWTVIRHRRDGSRT